MATLKQADAVRDAARAFFDKMAAWEIESVRRLDADDVDPEKRRAPLLQIFSEHLSRQAAARRQMRAATLSFSSPPFFAKPITNVEAGSDGSFMVYLDTPEVARERYHFVQEEGAWAVDYRSVSFASGRWEVWQDV